jgi:hypothetical protein
VTSHSTMREQPQLETEAAAQLFDNWFDPIEAGLRDRAREFLQAMIEGELDRSRYARRAKRSADASERTVGVLRRSASADLTQQKCTTPCQRNRILGELYVQLTAIDPARRTSVRRRRR